MKSYTAGRFEVRLINNCPQLIEVVEYATRTSEKEISKVHVIADDLEDLIYCLGRADKDIHKNG